MLKPPLYSYSFRYPGLEIENMWKLVCLNQFHDCLPGSAIEIAYDDVHKFHRQVAANSILLRHKAQTALLGNDSEESNEKGEHQHERKALNLSFLTPLHGIVLVLCKYLVKVTKVSLDKRSQTQK
ncbi:hypothetical protein INT44_004853 [Umbelopsis vinacea]|uniref:Glycoside hydrolase family 38 central domain-containing protein n=1 Tax=Umbelopsis vinacea TaxID=44442 RepID=A0A8H7Q7E9_9FUNG|nr:hypothetical protein INT44_004853 [Umbelopsis vinacea]